MGYALAAAARDAGAEVALVSGPVCLQPPDGVAHVGVVSAREMLAAAEAEFPRSEIAFFVAAVSDYRPAERRAGKPPKADGAQALQLVANPDIAATLGRIKRPGQTTMGFALEHEAAGRPADPELPGREVLARAAAKLQAKNLDLIAINRTDAMDAAASQVCVLRADGAVYPLPHQSKPETAKALVAVAFEAHAAASGRATAAGRSAEGAVATPWRELEDDQEG